MHIISALHQRLLQNSLIVDPERGRWCQVAVEARAPAHGALQEGVSCSDPGELRAHGTRPSLKLSQPSGLNSVGRKPSRATGGFFPFTGSSGQVNQERKIQGKKMKNEGEGVI